MLSGSEWVMALSTVMFWQAWPIRGVFIYWLAVGFTIGIKWIFKF